MLALSLVLYAATSVRATSRSIEIVYRFLLKRQLETLSYGSVQNLLLRLELDAILKAKEYRDDWVWIADHTVQVGNPWSEMLCIPGSSEVIESLFGKGKRLEGQQSRSGITLMLLAMALRSYTRSHQS